MGFSKEDRILIKEMRAAKGYGARRLLKKFPLKPWSLSGLTKQLKNIAVTGSSGRKPGRGVRRVALTDANIEAIEQLVISPEDKPGTHRTIREMARETGISQSSVHERLVEEWAHFEQSIIDGAVNQWLECLRACVLAVGGHFEQRSELEYIGGLSNDRPGS